MQYITEPILLADVKPGSYGNLDNWQLQDLTARFKSLEDVMIIPLTYLNPKLHQVLLEIDLGYRMVVPSYRRIIAVKDEEWGENNSIGRRLSLNGNFHGANLCLIDPKTHVRPDFITAYLPREFRYLLKYEVPQDLIDFCELTVRKLRNSYITYFSEYPPMNFYINAFMTYGRAQFQPFCLVAGAADFLALHELEKKNLACYDNGYWWIYCKKSFITHIKEFQNLSADEQHTIIIKNIKEKVKLSDNEEGQSACSSTCSSTCSKVPPKCSK